MVDWFKDKWKTATAKQRIALLWLFFIAMPFSITGLCLFSFIFPSVVIPLGAFIITIYSITVVLYDE